MSVPFKMKGSPMKRNFGISPMKQDEKWIDRAQKKHDRLTGKIEKAEEKGRTKKVARLTKRRTKHFKKTDARIKAED